MVSLARRGRIGGRGVRREHLLGHVHAHAHHLHPVGLVLAPGVQLVGREDGPGALIDPLANGVLRGRWSGWPAPRTNKVQSLKSKVGEEVGRDRCPADGATRGSSTTARWKLINSVIT